MLGLNLSDRLQKLFRKKKKKTETYSYIPPYDDEHLYHGWTFDERVLHEEDGDITEEERLQDYLASERLRDSEKDRT
jgi:hypothetical protein